MPRRKPKKSIEMMPGRMMASDNRKYQLRRPTMSIYPITSCGLRRLDAVEREPARRAQSGQDLQELLGGDNRREHTDQHPDGERDGKALDERRPEKVKDEAGDQRRDVRVPDRRPGAMHTGFHRGAQRPTRAQLLLDALEDQHVGVDCHADREDETREAGERERDPENLEDGQRDGRVEQEGEAGYDTRDAVVEQHEQDDDGEPKGTGEQAQLDR